MYLLDYSSKMMAYKVTVEKKAIKNNRLKKIMPLHIIA